jgi:hypothetical protein|tara:strand:- start:201 stop:347 length:147 start_codon:yes stop_codon:yes gene_type:complete
MDSLKVSGVSLSSMGIVMMEVLPFILGVTIAVMNIVYLFYKIKKIRES